MMKGECWLDREMIQGSELTTEMQWSPKGAVVFGQRAEALRKQRLFGGGVGRGYLWWKWEWKQWQCERRVFQQLNAGGGHCWRCRGWCRRHCACGLPRMVSRAPPTEERQPRVGEGEGGTHDATSRNAAVHAWRDCNNDDKLIVPFELGQHSSGNAGQGECCAGSYRDGRHVAEAGAHGIRTIPVPRGRTGWWQLPGEVESDTSGESSFRIGFLCYSASVRVF